MASDREVSGLLSEFARTLVTDFPIQAILDHLVQRIVEIMPISAAGVSLIAEGSAPRYIAASNGSALDFEGLQSELGEGPCIEAFRTGEAVAVPDIREDRRFPNFAPRAARMGLGAVFTFPLREGDERLGALDLYRDEPGGLDDHTMSVAQTLADVASAYVLNAQARADLREANDQFRELSLHDALTTLPNRVLLSQRLEHATMRTRRSGKQVAILFVDLDRFKEVNDTFGHEVGDQLLVAVAERLSALLRPGDTLARMSGDEFVILCEDLDDGSVVEDLASRIDRSFTETFTLSDHELQITASVGIAFSGPGVDVPERILKDADAAMYEAKNDGGAHHVLDLRGYRSTTKQTGSLQDLCGALTRGELRTEYQPIVRTVDGQVTGAEVLLRWPGPNRGQIMSETIVSLAERSGAIGEIGRWVLERACRDLKRWQDARRPDELMISVNVSPHQLMSADFAATVQMVLSETSTDAGVVTLEVTESVLMDDCDRALMVLSELREFGVRIALDDFGTGFSSLSYLRRFPVDVVKLDRRFVAGLGDPTTSAIVSTVVDLAHVLGMTVVAEGVETAAQHKAVMALGCEESQGYYFSRPMSPDAFTSLMHQEIGEGPMQLPVPVAV